MRLDLYLKKACLVRQRSVAKALCDAGAVRLNDFMAKASQTVSPGDRIRLLMGGRELELRVLELPHGNIAKRDAARTYDLLRETAVDPLEGGPAD